MPQTGRLWWVALLLAAGAAPRARAATAADLALMQPNIISSDIRGDTGIPVIINQLVGAETFYNAGFFGLGNINAFNPTVVANVEGGHIWNQHETLGFVDSYVNLPGPPGQPVQYDYHATAVGFTIAGLGPPVTITLPDGSTVTTYYYYQFGMAPLARLVSTAIATSFATDGSGSFNISTDSLVNGYRTTMQTGALVDLIPGQPGFISIQKPADIVNSSWGFGPNPGDPPDVQRASLDPAGIAQETMIIDALAAANHQTVTLAAGNDGLLGLPVAGPASGYNSIAVGALTGDLTARPYDQVADFSSQAADDFYNPVTGEYLTGVRPGVDLVAPGTDLILAAYTGTTGSDPFQGTDPAPGATNLYFIGLAGTSFASPLVAGGAALMVDMGQQLDPAQPEATDGRLIKAVLLNSAHKIYGWDNGTMDVGGVLTTTQGLDNASGAGALDLNAAFYQYLATLNDMSGTGQADGNAIGGGLFEVSESHPLDTFVTLKQGDYFASTADWFVNRQFDPTTNTASDVSFSNLDLELWKVQNGQPTQLVATSDGLYNNVEQLYLPVPESGDYMVRVKWTGEAYDVPGNTPHTETVGLTWSSGLVSAPDGPPTPEPMTALTTLGGLLALAWRTTCRRRG